MIMTEKEARGIAEKVLALTKADDCTVNLSGGPKANIRFARNEVTTSGTTDDMSLSVEASFGNKTGRSTVNQLDEGSLKRVVQSAEDIARISPEDPEHMPTLGPQHYERTPSWDEGTATLAAEDRATAAATSINACEREGLVAAGFMEHEAGFISMATSRGLFGYGTWTDVGYSLTARTEDGRGSGWAGRRYNAVSRLDVAGAAATAARRAKGSTDARPLPPGKYPVILDPSCVADLVQYVVFSMDARSADEGRSWASEKGGGTKLGKKVFPENITLITDPFDPEAPGWPWGDYGMPQKKLPLIENGVLKNLIYDRYWGTKQGKEPAPFPSNFIMNGGTASLDELISSTERAILVSSFWYIRQVDEQSLVFTGITRDGTFLIENGKIAYPVRNFRWNESPLNLLQHVEMMGKSARAVGRETGLAAKVPALKVAEFNFTSPSDAV